MGKQTCYEAVHWMYTNRTRPNKRSQDQEIKENGIWIVSQNNALNVFLNDKYNPNDKKMRRRAALMKDPTIREIWSQIKQFMDNKQWDDMMSYVNQLKEEDNNINNKETDNDNDSVDVEDTDKKKEKDDTDLSSITCSEYEEDENEDDDEEDDSCTTSESTSNSLRSKQNRTEKQKRT